MSSMDYSNLDSLKEFSSGLLIMECTAAVAFSLPSGGHSSLIIYSR